MLKIKVNKKFDFQIVEDKSILKINNTPVAADIYQINKDHFHVISSGKSFRVEVVEYNKNEKRCTVKVNSTIYTLEISNQYDELLHQLGLDHLTTAKPGDLKAPMPGLVLKILVSEGDEIKKGDNLLVLEAMKMENIIKASADAKIKNIKIKPADKLEKNQVMIVFE
ncbi:acetyl-CoA carboxylase biotin carboxyl carrier protein subunit [Daejeonella oryzae]|uniref:acetyl-CoA carboxylase biotin carboxyl carrier protein subunit n=1 Tax=Daejeonella oryzae TaxID=1122943 RepID=UPI0004196719|nr:acetyl-CoA carboxylase biotin carboxyl carrier protein subunit [Daejeonella oryzae]